MKTINIKRTTLVGTLATGMATGMLSGGCVTAAEEVRPVATAETPAASPAVSPYAKPGFHTEMDADGRLWVFKQGSPELEAFKAKGKPARHVVRPSAGPQGLTLKSVEMDHVVEYIVAKPGFHTELDADGRLWVFKQDSPELEAFKAKGKPARHVVRPSAGPLGLTLKSVEMDHVVEYIVAKPGFHTEMDKDGRLWVFKQGSPDLAEFKAKGKPARHVVRPGAGPLGLTLKATELETLDAYQMAR